MSSCGESDQDLLEPYTVSVACQTSASLETIGNGPKRTHSLRSSVADWVHCVSTTNPCRASRHVAEFILSACLFLVVVRLYVGGEL